METACRSPGLLSYCAQSLRDCVNGCVVLSPYTTVKVWSACAPFTAIASISNFEKCPGNANAIVWPRQVTTLELVIACAPIVKGTPFQRALLNILDEQALPSPSTPSEKETP